MSNDSVSERGQQTPLQIAAYSETVIGPIPAASELKKYEAIQSGFAERIFLMAEKEQDAKIELLKADTQEESKQNEANRKYEKIAQILGFVTIVLFMILATIFAFLKLETAICVLFGAGGIAEIAKLLYTRNQKLL
jgi:uncharacterized membrane protein